jgi:hypothetical protein
MARAWRGLRQPGYFGFGDVAGERAERGNRENSLSVMSFRVHARARAVASLGSSGVGSIAAPRPVARAIVPQCQEFPRALRKR